MNDEQKMALLESAQCSITEFIKCWENCVEQCKHEISNNVTNVTIAYNNLERAIYYFSRAKRELDGL